MKDEITTVIQAAIGIFMITTSLKDIVVLLETAISPAILISGVGLLLLTMTNRLGRVIDRQRLICAQKRFYTQDEQVILSRELPILWRRARLIRNSIILASFSVLFSSLIIILLFIMPLLGLALNLFVVVLFILCLTSLIASLFMFILDVNHALTALKFELEDMDKVNEGDQCTS